MENRTDSCYIRYGRMPRGAIPTLKIRARCSFHIAKQCEILVRGFARVGIIALVDEATGYGQPPTKMQVQEAKHFELKVSVKELLPAAASSASSETVKVRISSPIWSRSADCWFMVVSSVTCNRTAN